MNKKLIIPIILLIAIIGGIFVFYNMSDGSFANSKITVPNGFEVTRHNDSEIVVTNGITNYSVRELTNEKELSEYIEECKMKYDENNYVLTESESFGGIHEDSVVLKDNHNQTVHAYYFYKKNNKMYQLFTKGEFNRTAVDLIINSTV